MGRIASVLFAAVALGSRPCQEPPPARAEILVTLVEERHSKPPVLAQTLDVTVHERTGRARLLLVPHGLEPGDGPLRSGRPWAIEPGRPGDHPSVYPLGPEPTFDVYPLSPDGATTLTIDTHTHDGPLAPGWMWIAEDVLVTDGTTSGSITEGPDAWPASGPSRPFEGWRGLPETRVILVGAVAVPFELTELPLARPADRLWGPAE